MTLAYWCVLISFFIPYTCTLMAKAGGSGFPLKANHLPRDFLDSLQGWRRRSHFAQLNAFEVTPMFAIAVVIAHLTNGFQSKIDALALIFIISRVAYTAFYIVDWSTLRSVVWFVGMGCIMGLFFTSL